MAFGSRLTHSVAVVRRSNGATYDDYNHPVQNEAVLATVKAAIQPASAREQALQSQAGAVVADATIYLFPTDLTTADALVHSATDCPVSADLPTSRFEVVSIQNAAGLGHHLEVLARRVASPQDAEGS